MPTRFEKEYSEEISRLEQRLDGCHRGNHLLKIISISSNGEMPGEETVISCCKICGCIVEDVEIDRRKLTSALVMTPLIARKEFAKRRTE